MEGVKLDGAATVIINNESVWLQDINENWTERPRKEFGGETGHSDGGPSVYSASYAPEKKVSK